jgi:hypothetical protein
MNDNGFCGCAQYFIPDFFAYLQEAETSEKNTIPNYYGKVSFDFIKRVIACTKALTYHSIFVIIPIFPTLPI